MKNSIWLLLFLLSASSVKATNEEGYKLPVVVIDGETYPYVYLAEIPVYAEIKFKNKKQEEFYWRTVRDVKKTLPYAKLAGRIMAETDQELRTIPGEKERKAFLKKKEKELFDQFEDELKKMTVSQGKMLIRLVDRECDKTTFEIIKDYRGGFSAFFWQSIAKLFGANLKSEYDGSDKDKIIERVITLVESGQL